MPQKEVFLTEEGLEKLKAELDNLHQVRRHEIADQIERAKERGGTANNAEYELAKNEQAFLEGRIQMLEKQLQNAVIITAAPSRSAHSVRLGSRVKVQAQDRETQDYIIVGSTEADPREGKISNESPVGRALLGRRAGDVVEVPVPAGTLKLTIVEIK